MYSQYFGNYLINRKLITSEQLADVLEYQRTVRVKLGVLAINAGLMTPNQVEQVHNAQKKEDKRFGELAIEHGFINEENLKMLLETQKKGHLLLGQAIVDRGYFNLDQLQSALDDYKKSSGITERQYNEIGNNDTREIEKVFRGFGEVTLAKTYCEYLALFLRNMIRFIDGSPTIYIERLLADYKTDWFVHQEIFGKICIKTGISCDTVAFVRLAAKFANEDITEADELAKASMGEFLNLHNGIFLVNMSNSGIELEMQPQIVDKDSVVKSSENAYIINCNMGWGKFELIIG